MFRRISLVLCKKNLVTNRGTSGKFQLTAISRTHQTMAGSSGADAIATHEESLDTKHRGGQRRDQGADGSRGRGRGNRGGRGGRGGGGAGGEMNREVALSKALSKLLRHAAEDAGLKLDAEGFARVDQVMAWPRLKSLQVTFSDIQSAVADNAKQRFSMKANPDLQTPPDPQSSQPSDWVIRANQGHSIAIDSSALLVPITVAAGNIPDVVIHGTYFAFYQPIISSGGLRRMTRNHIHFSTGLPEDKQGVISGMRADAEILIYVDIKRSLDDGILWWLSENGVVLTEGDASGVLQAKYFMRVEGRRPGVGLLWLDGEQVAELPVEYRNRKPPMGKVHRERGHAGGRGGQAAAGTSGRGGAGKG